MSKSWRDVLPVHPAADLFPMMNKQELIELGSDIKKNGLRNRVAVIEGPDDKHILIDGRNRLDAMEMVGLEVVLEDVAMIGCCRKHSPDFDPYGYVISANIHRRHLTADQKRDLIAKLLKAAPEKSNRRIAKAVGVSHPHVGKIRTEMESAGDVETVTTSIDTKGRKQQAKRAIQRERDRKTCINLDAKVTEAERELAQWRLDHLIQPNRDRQRDKKERRAERERELAAKQQALPDKRYGVIYADPEWRFEVYSRDTGMDRAADNHYPTSGTDAICARPVGDIAADDCALFLWATVPMLPDALRVMAAWGFEYKSQFIWAKDRIGTGYWNRNQHEILLIGTRGAIPAPAPGTQRSSLIHAPVGAHSAKPEDFHELIESYFPNLPKIELNARAARPGWDAWGYEAEPP